MKLHKGSFVIGRVVSVNNEEQEAVLEISGGRKVVVDIFGHRRARKGMDAPVLPDVQDAGDVPAPAVGEELILVADRRSQFNPALLYARLWTYKSQFSQVQAQLPCAA